MYMWGKACSILWSDGMGSDPFLREMDFYESWEKWSLAEAIQGKDKITLTHPLAGGIFAKRCKELSKHL